MTNYFTQFCFALPESGSPERQAWARQYVKQKDADAEAPFVVVTDKLSGVVVSSEDESGNVDEAAQFAKAYLAKYNLDDTVSIDYANTASRSVLDGFGGGTIFVSKDGFVYPARFSAKSPQKIYTLVETRAGLLEEVQVYAARDRRDKAYFDALRDSQPEFADMSNEQLEMTIRTFDAGDEAEWHRDDPEIVY